MKTLLLRLLLLSGMVSTSLVASEYRLCVIAQVHGPTQASAAICAASSTNPTSQSPCCPPATPATKPTGKEREKRPTPPAHLFM